MSPQRAQRAQRKDKLPLKKQKRKKVEAIQ
jgi:hypothetical protein